MDGREGHDYAKLDTDGVVLETGVQSWAEVDQVLDVTGMRPMPQIGDLWNGRKFVRPIVVTPGDIQRARTEAVQKHLDDTARANGYDTIMSAISYAEEPAVPKWQSEGTAFRQWRSQVWAAALQILSDVQNGLRPIPTDDELIAGLPAYTPPA